MRYNENGEILVEHHVKYKEIHGVDETVWLTNSEHRLLHNRLRREGKCDIPPDELAKISIAANSRTDKHKSYMTEYHRAWRYKNPDKIKMNHKKYVKKTRDIRNKYQREYRARKKLEASKIKDIK